MSILYASEILFNNGPCTCCNRAATATCEECGNKLCERHRRCPECDDSEAIDNAVEVAIVDYRSNKRKGKYAQRRGSLGKAQVGRAGGPRP